MAVSGVENIDLSPPSPSAAPQAARPSGGSIYSDFLGYLPRTAESRPAPPDGQERKLAPINETGLPDEIVAEQTSAMAAKLNRLIDLSTERGFDNMMQNPIHFIEREFLNLCTKKQPDGHGGERLTVDMSTLQRLMGTKRGQQLALADRMNQLTLMAMGAAVRLSITPNSGEPRMAQGESSPLADRGNLRGVRDRIADWLGRPATEVEGRQNPNPEFADLTNGDILGRLLLASGVTGFGGALVGAAALAPLGPLGMVIGGAGGALIPPAVAGIINSLRAGKRIEVVQCVQALRTIVGGEAYHPGVPHANAGRIEEAEREWLRQFAGIDPTDLEVYNNHGQQAVRYRPNHVPHTLHDGRELRDRFVAESNALRKIQSAIGIPSFAEQGTDIDWLFNGNRGPQRDRYNGPSLPGQRGMDWDRKVMKVFNPNRGGVLFFNPTFVREDPLTHVLTRTGRWEPLEVEAVNHTWVTNPYLESARLTGTPVEWDMEGNARRYLAAYRDVLRQEISLAADEIKNGNVDYLSRFSKSINEQINARGQNGGQREKERQTQLQAQIDAITGLKNELKRPEVIAYGTQVDAAQSAINKRTEAENKVATVTVGGTALTVEQTLDLLLTDIATPAAQTSVDGESIEAIPAQRKALQDLIDRDFEDYKRRNPAVGKEDPTERFNKTLEKIEARYARREARIDRQEQKINDLLNALSTADQELQTAQGALAPGGPTITGYERTLTEINTSYTDITALNGTGGVALDQAALQGLTLNEVMQRINTANTTNNAVGWPEAENNDPERQREVFNAMIEARAIRRQPAILIASPNFTTATVAGLTETQLRTLTPGQIATRAGLTSAEALTIQAEALTRMRERTEAIGEINQLLDGEAARLQRQKDRPPAQLPERPLRMMERTIKQWGQIDNELVNMQAANNNAADLRLLTDRSQVAGNEYVQEELAAITGGGYLRWLNLIFDYQHATDLGGRGAAFTVARQLLPEATLAQLINNRFNFGTGTDLPTTFGALSTAIERGSISAFDIRQFIQQNIILGYLAPRVTTY